MAATTTVGSIKRYFRRLIDPRVVGRSQHLLVDIIVLAICGVIADCDDWHEIVLFAQKRLAWLQRSARGGHFGFVQHAVTGMLAPPGHVSASIGHPTVGARRL